MVYKMIDLHTHSFLSDGSLSVSELVYREKCAGYDAVAITDHVDESNLSFVISNVKRAIYNLSKEYNIKVVAGVELTYVPPLLIKRFVPKARKLGAQIVLVHGETPAENVPPGTNKAAILACVDVLAHPGKICEEDVKLAKKNNVCLEITSRRGHKETNKWVAEMAKKFGAKLVYGNDVHGPENIITLNQIRKILDNANLNNNDFINMMNNALDVLNKIPLAPFNKGG